MMKLHHQKQLVGKLPIRISPIGKIHEVVE